MRSLIVSALRLPSNFFSFGLRETEFFWEACDEYALTKTYYEMWFNYYYYFF